MNSLSSPKYRWVVLTLFLLLAGMSQLLWLNFAPLILWVEQYYGVSESTASLLLLVFPLIYVFLSIPAGALTDRRGYKYSVGLGGILMSVFACLRICHVNFWFLLLAQAGIAIGQPFVVNGISKLVMDWFPPEQGALATGLGTMGMFLGMSVGLAATPAMMESMGFQNTMIVFAGVTTALSALFLIFVKPNPLSPLETEKEVSLRDGFMPLIKNKDLLKIFFVAFTALGFFNGLTTWLELILAPNGLNAIQAGNVGGVLILGGIFGAVMIPLLSDHFQKRKIFLLGSFVVAMITVYPLCMSRSYGMVLALSTILGFFFLPAFALALEMCSELAGKALAGSATGVLMLTGNAGGVVMIIAMEAVKKENNNFYPAILLMVVVLAFTVFTALFIPETFHRKDSRQ